MRNFLNAINSLRHAEEGPWAGSKILGCGSSGMTGAGRDARGAACCRPSIGIGGHLAMPPLPHHRAYGSVPRRFGGLSTGQVFHGKQAQTTEASFGEGAMQSFREAQPPRSLGAEDGRTGRPFADLEPTELAIALTSRLPLDPGHATQAPSAPSLQPCPRTP